MPSKEESKSMMDFARKKDRETGGGGKMRKGEQKGQQKDKLRKKGPFCHRAPVS